MRKATVTYYFRDNKSVPMIRLRGKWLALAGFEKGTVVDVDASEGKLIISLAEACPLDQV